MSFPFESRSHAALRRRLMAAMGLLSGCASEANYDDGGGDSLARLHEAGVAPQPQDASVGAADAYAPQPQDASVGAADAHALQPQDASVDSGDAGGAIWFVPTGIECFTRERLEDQARWGTGMRRPDAALRTEAEIEALFLANGCLPKQHVADSCCNPAEGEATVRPDGTCCYAFPSSACCGRPFLVEGKARVARAMRRADWLSGLPELAGRSLPMPLRERAAAEWLEDARMEHASVAAFARFTLELLAFAAPADLVGESQLAGLDEIEHARMCFALASRYAGTELGPAALAMNDVAPAPNLRASVLSAVREGCIGETLAAARASAALEGTRDQTTRTVLAKIAEDETRHAELAYRYVAWALTREPSLSADIQELVRRESSLSAEIPNQMDTQMDVLEPALTLLGRLSPARARATQDSTFAHVILPCIDSLLSRHAEALHDGSSRGDTRAKSLA